MFNQEPLLKLIQDEGKTVDKLIKDKITEIIRIGVHNLFTHDVEWNGATYVKKPKPAMALINSMIQDKVCDQLTSDRITQYLDNNFDRVLQEELEKATRKAAAHIANKTVFTKANEGRTS